jgi:hypothetical protein
MTMKYFILGVLGGVLACALVLAAAFAVRVSRPSPELPPEASPRTGDVTISIQESYLGRMAAELARVQDPTIGTVLIDVQPAERVDMTVGLEVKVLGQTLDLQARLMSAVRVDNGSLRFDLQQVGFPGLGIPLDLLPESLSATLEKMVADVNDWANRMLAENGLVPLGVTTDDSSITVSLRAR